MARLYLIIYAWCLLVPSTFAIDITLKQNINNGENILTQEMFSESNCSYKVKYEFSLDGKNIDLPPNTTLVFSSRGSISNGVITGNKSNIRARKNKCIFNRVEISGVWNTRDIYSNWFAFEDDAAWNSVYFQNMCNLTSDNYLGVIHISKGDYIIQATKEREKVIAPNSNTIILLDGNIVLKKNGLPKYSIFTINGGKNNIKILGKGSLVGDVANHMGDKGQHGMGIWIYEADSILIRDINIKNCWGDCIYIGQTKVCADNYASNVVIENVTCDSGRRQGLSLIAGKNIAIRNCSFFNIGSIKFTPPGAGIDIEPNSNEDSTLENVNIDNCMFCGNTKYCDISTRNMNVAKNITISNCKIDKIAFQRNTDNLIIDSCEVNKVIYISPMSKKILFKNSSINSKLPRNKELVTLDNCNYLGIETSYLWVGGAVGAIILFGTCAKWLCYNK